jgi:hypothetical protein
VNDYQLFYKLVLDLLSTQLEHLLEATDDDLDGPLIPQWVRVDLAFGGPTEEGWNREDHRIIYDPHDRSISRSRHSQEKDCDGHFEDLAELMYDRPTQTWTKVNELQRDHEAERAGY